MEKYSLEIKGICCLVDEKWQLLDGNEACLELFSLTLEDLKTKNLQKLISAPDNFFKTAQTIPYTEKASYRENEFFITTMPTANGKIMVLFTPYSNQTFYSDLAAQMYAQKHTMIAEHLLTLEDYNGGSTHEINNPLAIAMGNAELFKMLLKKDDLNELRPKIEKSFDAIDQGLKRIRQITANMVEYAHCDEIEEASYFSLLDAWNEAKDTTADFYNEHQVELSIVGAEENQIVLANRDEFVAVLVNFLHNPVNAKVASEATGGKVDVSVEKISEKREYKITIVDDGPGVEDGTQHKVLFPYFVKKTSPATEDLSLALARKNMQNLRGDLHLVDSSEEGATFSFTIPMLDETALVYVKEDLDYLFEKKPPTVAIVSSACDFLSSFERYTEDAQLHFVGLSSYDEFSHYMNKYKADLVIFHSAYDETKTNIQLNCPIWMSSVSNHIANGEVFDMPTSEAVIDKVYKHFGFEQEPSDV